MATFTRTHEQIAPARTLRNAATGPKRILSQMAKKRLLPSPVYGRGAGGEGTFLAATDGDSFKNNLPHPALRATLSRRRERVFPLCDSHPFSREGNRKEKV